MMIGEIGRLYAGKRFLKMAEKNNEACDKWYNHEEGERLKSLDEKEGSNLYKEYLDTRHVLEVIVKPTKGFKEISDIVTVRCRPSYNVPNDKCDCTFEKTKKDIIEYYTELGFFE